jgi:hypothetical protein
VVPTAALGSVGPSHYRRSDQGVDILVRLIEACEACEIAGSCLERTDHANDLGLWDSPLCDPETCRSGGVDLPIGPWATGKLQEPTSILRRLALANLCWL